MREIILCQGHGANDGSDGTVTGRFTRTRPTVLARFAVCFKRIDEGGIKGVVVEDDLAFDLFASQGFEFVEVVHLHDIAADPFFRCRDGATECADRNFLRIACTRDDASAFFSAPLHPVRHPYLLQPNRIGAGFEHGLPGVFNGLLRLRRSAKSSTDIIRQHAQPVVGLAVREHFGVDGPDGRAVAPSLCLQGSREKRDSTRREIDRFIGSNKILNPKKGSGKSGKSGGGVSGGRSIGLRLLRVIAFVEALLEQDVQDHADRDRSVGDVEYRSEEQERLAAPDR